MLQVYDLGFLFICLSHLNLNRLWTNGLLSKPCQTHQEMSRMSRNCWTTLLLTQGIQIRFSFNLVIYFSSLNLMLFSQYYSSLLSWFSGLLANWRILWVPCEFPCKRRVRIQVLGWSCCATWQNKPSGLFALLYISIFQSYFLTNVQLPLTYITSFIYYFLEK